MWDFCQHTLPFLKLSGVRGGERESYQWMNVPRGVFSCCLREWCLAGDLSEITVGAYSSIGDRAVLHTSKSVEGKPAANVSIGEHVQVGPGAMLQSCTVESHAKIGAGAVVMEGALVEEYAQVAEGAVVHPGRRVPTGQVRSSRALVNMLSLLVEFIYGITEAQQSSWYCCSAIYSPVAASWL